LLGLTPHVVPLYLVESHQSFTTVLNCADRGFVHVDEDMRPTSHYIFHNKARPIQEDQHLGRTTMQTRSKGPGVIHVRGTQHSELLISFNICEAVALR
jgi:hypothetical protein